MDAIIDFMSNKSSNQDRRYYMLLLILVLIFSAAGCIAPENKPVDPRNIVGGVSVGISPKVIYADRGDNISFNAELSSTENANDIVILIINGLWFNRTFTQDIQAGGKAMVPVHITVPSDAVNTSIRVEARSRNLNATSSTSGAILIRRTGGQ